MIGHQMRLTMLDKGSVKSIGIFRALYLGDMLCIIPAVRALRAFYPDAKISLIGLSWQRNFVKRFPHYFDDFIDFPGWPGLPEQEVNAERIVQFLTIVRDRNFDLLFQMQGNGAVTNSMCLLWGARTVTGLRRAGEYSPDEMLFPVSEDHDHEILRFLKLTDALGIPRQGTDLEFNILDDELSAYHEMALKLNVPSHYLCIHPGARDKRRRWPAENFAFIADKLALQGYTIILTGSLEEKEILSTIQEKMDHAAINLVEKFGHISIGELAAFIGDSRMLISNDTGVSHVAAGLKIPSAVIFSPFSDMGRWAPLNTSLHLTISPAQAEDAEYVLYCILGHLNKHQTRLESPVLFNEE
jgi:ADP-heptose:LPS heptosyltransferase